MAAKQIFRQESLERLSSPDELDRLFTVVGNRAWIFLSTIGALLAVLLVWSIVGRVPETVEGVGVLINPGKVVRLESTGTGRISALRTKAGEIVEADQEIATIDQPELRQQLEQARVRLVQLQSHDQTQSIIETERNKLEKLSNDEQRRVLKQAITEAQDLAQASRERAEKFNKDQRVNLEENERLARESHRALEQKLIRLRKYLAERLVTEDVVFATEAAFKESKLTLSNLKTRFSELGIRETEAEGAYLQQRSRVADLNLQLQQLEIRANQLKYELAQSQTSRKLQIREAQDRVDFLEKTLGPQISVKSKNRGRVLELTVTDGQLTSIGTRLGSLEIQDSADAASDEGLRVLAYFQIRGGKLLQVGQAVRVTPVTVQRERFGGILGTVTRVSPFPVTQEAAATMIGNPELMKAVAQPGGMIEVEIELERDANSASGFRWTSAGPALKFTSGTPTQVRVTVEERAPITYLFPILRSYY
ncbi:MAG: NHLP bacteriocin system secretion protein [Gemmataceae bacterium]|nr:NHLP bacteriocin system secretion protein [Gemmataceae bacterium]